MVKWIWKQLINRYDWLRPDHPIALRDEKWMPFSLPTFIRRLAAPWTMVGYAAVLHGVFFVFSVVAYNQAGSPVAVALMPFLSAFLTPFGTPIAAGFLHSILYWAMLIGLCNQVTYTIGAELERGTWNVLRATPYTAGDIFLAKLAVVGRVWWGVLRTLLIVRLVALMILPLAVASQRTRETNLITSLDVASALLFLAQPYVEAFLAVGISALMATVTRNVMWAKVYAYGTVAVVLGGLSGFAGFWLAFTSPIGAMAGLLVPLGHWAPLVAAVVPPRAPNVYTYQTVVLVLTAFVLPLLIGTLTMRGARKRLLAFG